MKSTDTLRHFLLEHSSVQGEIVHLDASWQAVVAQKAYPKAIQILLGDLVVSAVLLSATMRLSGSITMQVKAEGPLKLLVVECRDGKSIRAMAHWEQDWDSSVVNSHFDLAQLVMTLDPDNSTERYQGIIDLSGSTIAEALENYLMQNGQINARLRLANDNKQAAGILLQRSLDDDLDYDSFWNQALEVAREITEDDLLELPVMELISRFQNRYGIRVFADETISFQCSCTQERVDNVLRWLGEEEVMAVIEEMGKVHVECEFCGHAYSYDAVDISQLFHESFSVEQPGRPQ